MMAIYARKKPLSIQMGMTVFFKRVAMLVFTPTKPI